MKKIMLALLFVVLTAAPAFAVDTNASGNNTSDYMLQLDTTTDTYLDMGAWTSIAVCQSVIFGDHDLEISWDNGIIDIKYGNNVTKTEAADIFFDFLKRYIREGYRIIPKERK